MILWYSLWRHSDNRLYVRNVNVMVSEQSSFFKTGQDAANLFLLLEHLLNVEVGKKLVLTNLTADSVSRNKC